MNENNDNYIYAFENNQVSILINYWEYLNFSFVSLKGIT